MNRDDVKTFCYKCKHWTGGHGMTSSDTAQVRFGANRCMATEITDVSQITGEPVGGFKFAACADVNTDGNCELYEVAKPRAAGSAAERSG
jgi:hypothetical protein